MSQVPPPIGSASLVAVIGGKSIEIQELAVRSESFDVSGTASIMDLATPNVAASFSVDTTVESALKWGTGRDTELAGPLHIYAEVNWPLSDGGPEYAGLITATGLSLGGRGLESEFQADFSGNDQVLELQRIDGRALGGELLGTARIQDPLGDPLLSISGTVLEIAFDDVARVFDRDDVPWDALVNVSIEGRGSKSEGFSGDVDLVVHPPVSGSQLPMSGYGSIGFDSLDAEIAISELSLGTPDARLEVAGSLPLGRPGRAEITASVGSLQTLRTILDFVGEEFQLPDAAPDGRYSFQGEVRSQWGRLHSAALEGEWSIEDFVLGGQRWQSLTMVGEFNTSGMDIRRGRLADGEGLVEFLGTAPIGSQDPLQLVVSASKLGAGKLAKASGFDLPIDGSLTMDLELAGSLEAPLAWGTVSIENPSFFTEQFDRLEAAVGFGADGFELRDALLIRADSTLEASATLDPTDKRISIDLASNRWPLHGFEMVRALDPQLKGSVRFEVRGTGILGGSELLRTLRLEGSWNVADLRREGVDLGHWNGKIRSGSEYQSLELDLDAKVFGGTVLGRAALWQVEPTSYSGNVDYHDLDPGFIAELMDLPGDAVEGEVTGSASFGGVVGLAEAFEVNGTIASAEIRVAGQGEEPATISNLFPMRWGIRHGALRLDSMNFSAPGTAFEVDGAIPVFGEGEMDLGLEGTLDLALLAGFIGDVDLKGRLGLNARMTGTRADPSLGGTAEILDASVSSPDSPFRLGNMSGRIHVEDNQWNIEQISATSGGGNILLDGAMVYQSPGFEYRIQATAENMRIDRPRNLTSVIDGQFTLAGAGSRSILDGDVLITAMSTADNVSFADLFSSMEKSEGDQAASPFFQGMQLNLRVGSVSHLPVETTLVRDVTADFDLEVVGTSTVPSVLGTIAVGQGELRMLGTHYTISRGDIRFVNPLQAEPVLNMELETRIRDVDIALVLSGPADTLNLSYRSDPPLPFHDLVDLVVVGKEPTTDPSIAQQRRIEQQSLVQTGADNLLSQAIARPMSRRLQRFFGVSRLKVDPQIGGLEANPSARISTEQQIADDLTLIYSYDLSSAQQQAIRIEWNPDRRWSFIVTRDQNGLVGSDVLFKMRLP